MAEAGYTLVGTIRLHQGGWAGLFSDLCCEVEDRARINRNKHGQGRFRMRFQHRLTRDAMRCDLSEPVVDGWWAWRSGQRADWARADR